MRPDTHKPMPDLGLLHLARPPELPKSPAQVVIVTHLHFRAANSGIGG